MPQIAFMTIGMLRQPRGNPEVQGFFDRVESVYGAADKSSGFVDRSRRNEEWGHSWGEIHVPQTYPEVNDPQLMPTTLSIWHDLESVAAYAYRGPHGEAMSQRKEWFLTHDRPTYVAWWVEDGHVPNWTESNERLDHLHRNGPTAFAFDFKKPFDANGEPIQLDPSKVKAAVGKNGTSEP